MVGMEVKEVVEEVEEEVVGEIDCMHTFYM